MKQKHGPWYWLSLLNPVLLFGAMSGRFGREAQDEAQSAIDDLRPAAPALVWVGLAMLTVIALSVAYLAFWH